MQVNGEQKTLDVLATIINGIALVPLRVVAKSFGANVNWDGENNIISIN